MNGQSSAGIGAGLQQRRDEYLAHPRFAEARRAHVVGYLEVYSGEPMLNKLLVEASRHIVITFVMCLDSAQRPDDPETWLTLGKLQDVVTAYKVGSPGLVEAIVQRMLDRGLLSSHPAPGDRRKRILAPTEAMLAHDLDLIAAQALPCSLLAPGPVLALALARDREMQRAVRVASLSAFGEAMAMLQRHPEILPLIMRDSGMMVLLSLMRRALDTPSGNMASSSYADTASRFGISRTHVREIVADAEKAGFVRVHGSGGAEVELLPRLWAVYDVWLADCMALFDACCTEAVVHLERSRAQPVVAA